MTEAKKIGMGYGMLKEQVSSARKKGLAVKEAQARIDKKVLPQGICSLGRVSCIWTHADKVCRELTTVKKRNSDEKNEGHNSN